MKSEFDPVRVKLLTIVASSQLEPWILERLRALDVSGYTKTKADGWGLHGSHRFGLVDSGNVRIEVLVREELAKAILQDIAVSFAEKPIVAYSCDVDAVPASHFS